MRSILSSTNGSPPPMAPSTAIWPESSRNTPSQTSACLREMAACFWKLVVVGDGGASRRPELDTAPVGVDALFVVGDGRYLPFHDGIFDQAFSYSVLQHLSKDNARATLREIHRVLRPDGASMIQMANKLGPRSLYNQMRQ